MCEGGGEGMCGGMCSKGMCEGMCDCEGAWMCDCDPQGPGQVGPLGVLGSWGPGLGVGAHD